MSYARNLLSRGEEIVFESRQHWFAVVAETWLYIIGAVVALADRKSTRLNSSHELKSRMPSSA